MAGAAGFFALAGERVARIALGSSYGGGTGAELGRLVAYLAPWMVASDRALGRLPSALRARPGVVAARCLAPATSTGCPVLVVWGARAWLGLAGVAAGMAVTTFAILGVLLFALGALRSTLRGLAVATAACGLPALVLYGAPRLAVSALPAAAIGIVLYAAVLALWRPAGLRSAWGYLRHLHDG